MIPARSVWLLLLLVLVAALDEAAQAPRGTKAEICLLPREVGRCRARIPRYYYDRRTQSCSLFYYGGCEGNANNFNSWKECHEACWMIESPSYCYSPKDKGLCSANVTRYHFNPQKKDCDAFTYTGCGGNENNFVNLQDCRQACMRGGFKKEKKIKTLTYPFVKRRMETWKKKF